MVDRVSGRGSNRELVLKYVGLQTCDVSHFLTENLEALRYVMVYGFKCVI